MTDAQKLEALINKAAGYEWNTWRPGDPGFTKLYYRGHRITPDTEIVQ